MKIGIGAKRSGYWIYLLEYLHKKSDWQAFLFTEEIRLLEAIREEQIDFLFLQDTFLEERDFQIPCAYFGTRREPGVIYPYQSVDDVYMEMRSFIGQEMPERKEQGKKIYGIYSPLGRSGKTSFAMAYAKRHSFFYIGMEEYGLQGNNSFGVGDLIYHIHNRKENLPELMCSMMEERKGVQMLASPTFFSDIHLMEVEDFRWFLEQVREDTKLPSVFVDFGTGTLLDMEVLDYFDKVYVPVLSGVTEEEKLRRFWELLWEVNGDMKDKMIKIVVPQISWEEEGFLEQVQYVDGLSL